ncbi:MAG: MFS transporter [Burkholderiales bacterium]
MTVPDSVPPPLFARIFIPFACGYFISYLFRTINAVISPKLTQELGLDATSLGLLTSAYFFAFALFQFPLGVLLDRFGPRRVQTILLLIASSGALIFGLSHGLNGLLIGRALIGLGVSGCLMAAFKAFTQWFPLHKLPLMNGYVLAAGGLGALTATIPVEAALRITDWHGIFIVLSVATLLVAALVFFVYPERERAHGHATLREQLRGAAGVFASGKFWRIAPLAISIQSVFMAVQGLWGATYLRDVAKLAQADIAQYLFAIAGAMFAGQLLSGAVATALAKRGFPTAKLFTLNSLLILAAWSGIAMQWFPGSLLAWMIVGFCGSASSLSYSILTPAFAQSLSGRVNTAMNLMVFVFAFIAQWAIGAIINLWPATAEGYATQGYEAAFLICFTLQCSGLVWYLVSARRFPL